MNKPGYVEIDFALSVKMMISIQPLFFVFLIP